LPKPVQQLALEAYGSPRSLTHGLFRFPGRFHPPLVAYLLGLHPQATIIGDPMVGSGTVSVQAVAYGKSGIFSDVDPLSCLLTRAKSRPVSPNWLTKTIEAVVERARPLATPGTTRTQARKHLADLEGSTPFRAPPNVFHWFRPYVVVNLSNALGQVAEVDCSSRRKDALLAVFAGVLRRLSRADPNTSSGLEVTKIRLQEMRSGLAFDLASELHRKASLLAHGYRQISKTSGMVKVDVVQHDAKDWSSLCRKIGKWPDLVITSPCYISAIEYWRRHKLEYSWLGLVPPERLGNVKRSFLGMGEEEPDLDSLPRYVKTLHSKLCKAGRRRDARVMARYFCDSSKWLNEVATVIAKTSGTAYVVAGSNSNHGLIIDTPSVLQQLAALNGLSAATFMRYRIANSYMQYPTNAERIKTETVLRLTTR
jgi:hypothetical protein